MTDDKTQVDHIDIAISEVMKTRIDVNTNAQKDRHDKVLAQLRDKQNEPRQIPKRGTTFVFECETCANSYVEPPSPPSEECTECGAQVHMLEMPADLWDEKYEVKHNE